nr:cytochrome P450 monooxygenase CYP349R1 [Lasioderma serricorne]
MDTTTEELLSKKSNTLILTNLLFKNLTSVILLISIALILQYHWNRRRLYIMARQVHGPIAWPIIGSALWFFGSTENILNNVWILATTFKPPLAVWLGQKLFFAISSPQHLETIMNSPHALEKDSLYKFAEAVTGKGLFTAKVSIWRKHRKLIMQTFNQKVLNGFIPIFEQQAKILTNDVFAEYVGKGDFETFNLMSKFTLDTVCETMMGIKMNAQKKDCQYVDWINKALEICYLRMFQLWYHSDFIFNRTKMAKEMKYAIHNINNFTSELVREKRKEYKQRKIESTEAESNECPIKRKALLDYLIELSEESSKFTDDEIVDEVNTIIVAGNDSTATMNSFTLVMLGMHQDIQEKVYSELEDIFGDEDRSFTCEDLTRMKYLERVIKETLRLFPVGPVIVRAITEDVKLDTFTMPKGSSTVITIIHTHRNPEIWPNPLKFDPDRFLPEEVSKRHPYAFVPFSGGPRNCIGIKYAMMSMKVVIATIVRRYKIFTKFKEVADIKLKSELIIKSASGNAISLEERKNA